jgi:hypothetical protein
MCLTIARKKFFQNLIFLSQKRRQTTKSKMIIQKEGSKILNSTENKFLLTPSKEDLSHNTPGEMPRPKQSQFKSPLDTSVSNKLYVEDCESPVCTRDRKFMQTPIRVKHKSSPIVRFVNNEERPKGRYYPKVETGSPSKPRKPNPVDEGDGVSVAPLARVKWCPPRPLKRGERGDSIVTSNIEYQE